MEPLTTPNPSKLEKTNTKSRKARVEASDYKNFLNEFFASDNEDYKEFSGSGNVKRPNVEARYEILRDECYKYFKLELPSDDENSIKIVIYP